MEINCLRYLRRASQELASVLKKFCFLVTGYHKVKGVEPLKGAELRSHLYELRFCLYEPCFRL